jgi:hypothetical protein
VLCWQMGVSLGDGGHVSSIQPNAAWFESCSAHSALIHLTSHCSKLTSRLYIQAACRLHSCTAFIDHEAKQELLRAAGDWYRARTGKAVTGQSCGDPQASSGGENML